MSQVRALFLELERVFQAYSWLDSRLGGLPGGPAIFEQLVRPFRQIAQESWRQHFGAEIDSPAHRRFVLQWCLRNLEVLTGAGRILPVDRDAIVASLRRDLETIEESDPDYRFQAGRDTAHDRELKKLYLAHNLNIRLHLLSLSGAIGAGLYGLLRGNLVRRAAALFTASRGEAEAGDPALDARRVVDGLRSRGLIPEALHQQILRLFEPPVSDVPPADEGPRTTGDPLAELGALTHLIHQTAQDPAMEAGAKARALERLSEEVSKIHARLRTTPDPELVRAFATRAGIAADPVPEPLAAPAPELTSAPAAPAPAPELTPAAAAPAPDSPAPEPQNRDIAWISDEWAIEILRELDRIEKPPALEQVDLTREFQPPEVRPAIVEDFEPFRTPSRESQPPTPPPPTPPPAAPTRELFPHDPDPIPVPIPPPVRRAPPPPRAHVTPVTRGAPAASSGPRRGTPAEPPEDPGVRDAWISMLSSLLQEFGIHWLLFSGVLLTLAAGILGAVQQWEHWSPVARYLYLLGATGGFYLLALGTRLGMRLTKTPAAFFVLVLLFIPLNFVAMNALGLFEGSTIEKIPRGVIAATSIALLLFMGCSGTRVILDLPPLSLTPGLVVVSSIFLAASWLGASMALPHRVALLLGSLLIARFQLVGCLALFHRQGLAALPLVCLVTAVVATGLRLGLDLTFVGLSLVAAAHLTWETGLILHHLADPSTGPRPAPFARGLAMTGEIAALIGASLLFLPADGSVPVCFLAVLYLGRMMYLSFVTFHGGFEFLVFLPCPAILFLLFPELGTELRELLLGALLRSVRGVPGGEIVVRLLPLVLAAPFYARLSARLHRRGLEDFRALLHHLAAALALLMLALISPFTLVAQAGCLLMGIAWAGMAYRYRFQYMVILSTLAGVLGLVEVLRYMGAPSWALVMVLSTSSLIFLGIHHRTAGRLMEGFDPYLCGPGISLAISQTSAAGTLLALVWVHATRSAGYTSPGWDLCLMSQILYFGALMYVDFQVGLGLFPVGLFLLELGSVAHRLGWVDGTIIGVLPAGLSLLPLLIATWLGSPSGRSWLIAHGPAALGDDATREELAHYHLRFTQALGLLAFVLPPYSLAAGVIKYLSISFVFWLMGRRSDESAAFSLFSLGMAIHSGQLERMTDPEVVLIYQVLDAVTGLFLVGWVANRQGRTSWERVASVGGVTFLALSVLFYVLPILDMVRRGPGMHTATLWASLVQSLLGVGAIVFARRAGEIFVFLGEAALLLVYGRLLMDGWVTPSLIAAFVALAAAFVMQIALPRMLQGESMDVYRRPATWTALALPLLSIHRGLLEQGAYGGLLLVGSAFFYHLVSVTQRRHEALVLSLVLYNAAAALAPEAPGWLTASRYLVPLGLTLIAYSHASYLGRPRETVQFWRTGGLTLLYIDIIPRSVMGAHPGAFVLTLVLCVGIALLGILFRTKIYVLTGTCLMIITVIAVVIREVIQASTGGFLSLFFMGIFLIVLAAVFEGARERLRGVLEGIQARFGDWD